MASFHEIFGDGDPDESFERFRDSDINDSTVTSTIEEDDDEDDISVKSLSSDEEESEESTDESSSDESNDVAAPRTGGTGRQSVKENVVTWSEKKTNVKFPRYNEMPGPTVTLDADKVELDFFALMFNLDLCVWIAAETNRYAKQLQRQKGRRDMKWKPTTSDQIRAYLGIRICMSVIDLPDIKMYWSGDLFFWGIYYC